ncbi:MAG: hypothetical protein K1Y02_06155 [Candidatus Hydrogenedentes bacterium]|nr:hypothetical protein [Candidatus Hydrogenedentota bacterium]
MKSISAVVAESGQIRDLTIMPGTTAEEIIREVGLPSNYLITRGRGQSPFGQDENVYEKINNGEKIFLSTPVEVGA